MNYPFKIHILGSSAAIPTSERHTTAQLIKYHNKKMLFDCGEGTQIQLRRYHLPMLRIDHIFISHLHGDHYLGLPGLIFSMHLLGRKRKLHIYAPQGLKEIIELQYEITKLIPGFSIEYHLIEKGNQKLYEDNQIKIETIEMTHRLPTYGFLITEKPFLRNIRKEVIEMYGLTVENILQIKAGKDHELTTGEIIPNEYLTIAPSPPRKYAFCSDTVFTEDYIEQIKNVDLLYHEATFLNDKTEIAREKMHCTASQAALIAQKAGVKQLMLGHYSARYDELSEFTDEAKVIFENTIMAEEGMTIEIEQTE